MASMQEWTQPVPREHTHWPVHAHVGAHREAYKLSLATENTDA